LKPTFAWKKKTVDFVSLQIPKALKRNTRQGLISGNSGEVRKSQRGLRRTGIQEKREDNFRRGEEERKTLKRRSGLFANVVFVSLTITVVVQLVTSFGGGDDLAVFSTFFTDLLAFVTTGKSSAADAFTQSTSGAGVTGSRLNVVHKAIAVIVFAVASFAVAGEAVFVVIVAVAIEGVTVFVTIFDLGAFPIATELTRAAIFGALLLADTLNTSFTGATGGHTELATQAVVTDITVYGTGGVALNSAHTLPTGADKASFAFFLTGDRDTFAVFADSAGRTDTGAAQGLFVVLLVAKNTFAVNTTLVGGAGGVAVVSCGNTTRSSLLEPFTAIEQRVVVAADGTTHQRRHKHKSTNQKTKTSQARIHVRFSSRQR
jgi:hypothetical protein